MKPPCVLILVSQRRGSPQPIVLKLCSFLPAHDPRSQFPREDFQDDYAHTAAPSRSFSIGRASARCKCPRPSARVAWQRYGADHETESVSRLRASWRDRTSGSDPGHPAGSPPRWKRHTPWCVSGRSPWLSVFRSDRFCINSVGLLHPPA